MMKKLGFIAIFVIIVAGVIIYLTPEYRAWFERQSEQILPENVTHTKAYRWRDKNGQWQLSDKPPAAGIDYEIVEYHKDTNVIPSEKLTGKTD
jgi:hypothetical protein